MKNRWKIFLYLVKIDTAAMTCHIKGGPTREFFEIKKNY